MSAVHVVPGVTDADLAWLRGLAQIDSPVPSRCVDLGRLRRMLLAQYVEERHSPRQGLLVLLTPKGRDLVREFTEDEA
jgi:hypothetical protein